VVREDREALSIPHRWRKPRKIFVNSMSDLFHEQVSDAFILEVSQVMRETPRHGRHHFGMRGRIASESAATTIKSSRSGRTE
jgi:protein gp37